MTIIDGEPVILKVCMHCGSPHLEHTQKVTKNDVTKTMCNSCGLANYTEGEPNED